MTEDKSTELELGDFWKLWTDSPWARQWVMWSKWLWAGNPMSKLIPLDPEEIWKALVAMGDDMTARPELLEDRTSELLRSLGELSFWAWRKQIGQDQSNAAGEQKKDSRFADEAGSNNLVFSTIKQSYLIFSSWLLATAQRTEGLDAKTRRSMLFCVREFVHSMSPSNFVMTNPVALQETLNTGGENLRRGMQNLLDDI